MVLVEVSYREFFSKKCYKRVLRNDCPRPPPLIKFDGGMA